LPILGDVTDEVFHAIADPTRRRILDDLAARDGMTLFEICTRLLTVHGSTLTRQAISQHLAVLEGAGLVRAERVGRTKVHHLDTAPLRPIVDRWPLDRTPTKGTP
jgi:DNA-binding transcriptional ArsR family regulator